MAYVDSDGHMCPETTDEIRAELDRITIREADIQTKHHKLGDQETEWQLANCRVMRHLWELAIARLQGVTL